MKKFTLLMFCFLGCVMSYATVKEVDVKAGTLGTLMTADEVTNLTDLKLTGNLNGTDFKLIRKMCSSSGHLANLDIGDANIVSGGDDYMFGMQTENNVLGIDFFCGCDNLVSIILPKSVQAIEGFLFVSCKKLTHVEFPPVKSVGEALFGNCPALETVDLPKSVTTITINLFYQLPKLKEVSMPGVRIVPDSTFINCVSLEKMTLGAVQQIGAGAFKGNTSLKYIYLPAGLEGVSENAFANCSRLATVVSMAKEPPTCGKNAFGGVENGCIVYVQTGCGESYRDADEWNQLKIVETDLTGIEPRVTADKNEEVERYDLSGRKLAKSTRGVNIVRMKDGSSKKVMVK
jgi:hypothetical protein